MMSEQRGEVYDLGYQRYYGPREGRARARWALLVNGIRSALGIGRGSRAKVLPVLLFVAAVGPAVIMVIIASQAGPGFEVPGHAGYYSIISVILPPLFRDNCPGVADPPTVAIVFSTSTW